MQALPKPGCLARGLPMREGAGCDMHGVDCYSGLMIEPGACGTAAYDQTGVVQGHEGEGV